jgi:hypothetical protein
MVFGFDSKHNLTEHTAVLTFGADLDESRAIVQEAVDYALQQVERLGIYDQILAE